MSLLAKFRERVLPQKKTFRLFEDVGTSHEVTATIYSHPFRHIVIDNFLPEVAYQLLAADFARVLGKGISTEPTRDAFTRFDLYDLYSWVPKPTLDLPYGCFFAETYFQALESALARVLSRTTFATFHHHTPNPEDNYIHDDYVYEYFARDPLANGTNAWYYQCDKYEPSEKSYPMIRAAAAIYYLNNDGWKEGDGGETGIFATKEKDSLVRAIAPKNNRLTVFDITPRSYHNYRACRMEARNSLAQWFFVAPRDALARFPGTRPGGWERLQKTGQDSLQGQ